MSKTPPPSGAQLPRTHEGRTWWRLQQSRLRELRLRPRPAAVVGALAGVLVGLAVVNSMRRHQVFTEPYQDLTAGAALLVLWVCIGTIAGLSVLSPEDGDEPPAEG